MMGFLGRWVLSGRRKGSRWQTDTLQGWHSARSGFPVLEPSVRKHSSFKFKFSEKSKANTINIYTVLIRIHCSQLSDCSQITRGSWAVLYSRVALCVLRGQEGSSTECVSRWLRAHPPESIRLKVFGKNTPALLPLAPHRQARDLCADGCQSYQVCQLTKALPVNRPSGGSFPSSFTMEKPPGKHFLEEL